jgi:hypothetical protein
MEKPLYGVFYFIGFWFEADNGLLMEEPLALFFCLRFFIYFEH